jgi:hypothetical protein
MWRPNDPDVSAPLGIDPQGERRRSRRRAWRDGLADQTVIQGVEDVRSYRAFERALIGSLILGQRSSLRSLTGWQACCDAFVAPARSKPAC